jgi:hypothetical protein
MLKGLYDVKELSHVLGVSKPQVMRLRQGINDFLQAKVFIHNPLWQSGGEFNPKLFLELRAAFRGCGEELPPLTFEKLLELALDNVATKPKWVLDRSECPSLEISEYLKRDGVEGIISMFTREQWNIRSSSWKGFEDIALPHIIVLIYEKTSIGWLVEAIASKGNKQQDVFINSLLKLDGTEGICIHVKKTLIEPTGRISNRIREVLSDQIIKEKGYVPEIAHALKRGYYCVNTSSSPERDELLKILKSEDWLRNVEDERETFRYFLPIVSFCYANDFSDDERRKYEIEGLLDSAVIGRYGYLCKEHYELSLPIPYTVSSDPLFPFHEGDKVKVRLQEKSLIITMLDERTASNESKKV